jgi:hypothetical protein
VPVPVEAEQVIQTIVDNVLFRGKGRTVQLELALETPDNGVQLRRRARNRRGRPD